MNLITNLVEYLKKEITIGLPGDKAHLEMVPGTRISAIEALNNQLIYRESAVSVILYPNSKHYNCILIKRANYKGAHSGQIAFPGGKKETCDLNLFETACRETYEEIHVSVDESSFIGSLSPVYIPISNFMVHPHVFLIQKEPQFQLQEREVRDIITFPLDEILNKNILQKKDVLTGSNMKMRNVPCFMINNHVVWGATALIMNELRHLIRNAPLQIP